ncbi:hypothetical protein TELCIR_07648 [Teladorsagia circumcincta]|uniref:Uncharacterized protein n=1 Tax=Teladorsagia circumcincta TaxID=45464 RepID=A0A2G9UJU5_TELCI|nr:hypothetical protein TELCIR_07648 [Teladorsagia circumcincta]
MHQSLLSHDDINLVEVEDEDLSQLLKSMHENGELNNTMVIVMADHGHRFAKLRGTHQGQLEERLPFFSIALPADFRETAHGKKMYENLQRNKDRLVPNEGVLKYKNVKDKDGFVPDLSGDTGTAFAHYQIKLRTTPGVALYEVTLFYDSKLKEVHIDLGAISHPNKFGDAPHCIINQNYFLATYCVCHDKV